MEAPCPAKRISFASYGHGDAGVEPVLFVANVSVDLDDDEAERLLRRTAPDERDPWRSVDDVLSGLEGRVLIDLTDRRLALAHHLAGSAIACAEPRWCGSELREELRSSFAGMLAERLKVSREGFAAEIRGIDARLARDPANTLIDLFGGCGSLLEKLFLRDPRGVAERLPQTGQGDSLLQILDRDGAERSNRDHMAAWGGVHRTFDADWITEEDGAAVHSPLLPRVTSPTIRLAQPGWGKPWVAWRIAQDVKRSTRDDLPALELAWRVARMAASAASDPSGAPAAVVDWLRSEGFGDRSGEGEPSADDRPEVGTGDREASNASGETALADSRDRLLLKMHSRDCPLGHLASLRIEHLHVDGFGDVYDRTDETYPYPLYSMDAGDRDDFWRLARRAGSVAGWLFSALDAPYGRRALKAAEAEAIVALGRFTFENELEVDGHLRADPWRWKRDD